MGRAFSCRKFDKLARKAHLHHTRTLPHITLLLTQMAIVLLVTVVCGWLALKLGQARVIGEIVGGILVGPSVFGRIAPHAAARIFPQSSFDSLDVLSTI